MTKLSKSAFLIKYAAIFADNVTRDISEEDIRDFRQDISDSFLSIDDNFLDEDDFASDSATKAPSQQSVKAYVEALIAVINDFWPLGGSADLTANVIIDGLTFGIRLGYPNNLDHFNVYADSMGMFIPLISIQSNSFSHLTENNNNHGINRIFWYDQQIDNSAGGTPLATTSDKDLFDTLENATCLIELRAVAVASDGSESAAIHRTYHFRRDGSANPTLISETGPFISDESAGGDAVLTVSTSNIRLTMTTPANKSYMWTVYADVFITNSV